MSEAERVTDGLGSGRGIGTYYVSVSLGTRLESEILGFLVFESGAFGGWCLVYLVSFTSFTSLTSLISCPSCSINLSLNVTFFDATFLKEGLSFS